MNENWHPLCSSSSSTLHDTPLAQSTLPPDAASYPRDITYREHAPDSVEDPIFCGIDADATVLCRMHKLKPEIFVAFEGTMTGRRFHLCPLKNEAENCGFVGWIDPDWHGGLQNALARLWAMHQGSENHLIESNHQNATLLHNISEQKKKVEKKYSSLIQNMDNWMNETHQKLSKNVLEEAQSSKVKAEIELAELKKQNVQMLEQLQKMEIMKQNEQLEVEEVRKQNAQLLEQFQMVKAMQKGEQEELKELKKQRAQLLEQLQMVKAMQKDEQRNLEKEKKHTAQLLEQFEMFKAVQKGEQKELEELKQKVLEQKEYIKKLEHNLYDLFHTSQASREKLNKIKEICET